jgi:hypothetical protein
MFKSRCVLCVADGLLRGKDKNRAGDEGRRTGLEGLSWEEGVSIITCNSISCFVLCLTELYVVKDTEFRLEVQGFVVLSCEGSLGEILLWKALGHIPLPIMNCERVKGSSAFRKRGAIGRKKGSRAMKGGGGRDFCSVLRSPCKK